MNLIKCCMTQSTCYRGTTKGKPVGILWHDTGAGNPELRRYVQPDDNDPSRADLLKMLGNNQFANDWNHQDVQAGLNAWIGKLANGSVASVQTMPWDYRPWGCGGGSKGSCNGSASVENSPFWIQFEICDDGYKEKAYFNAVYKEAVELTAYLCKTFGIDPNGTVSYRGATVPTILCHADSNKLGLGSAHGDVLDWFRKMGKTMDDVRRDVAAKLAPEPEPKPIPYPHQPFEDVPADAWYAADVKWAYENGITYGVDATHFKPDEPCTRAQVVTFIRRAVGMLQEAQNHVE